MQIQCVLINCGLIGATVFALALPMSLQRVDAGERPQWAYPVTEPNAPAFPDDGHPRRVPGTSKSLTIKEAREPMNAPDWFPSEHPPMPEVVVHGRPGTAVRACAGCHLVNGLGYPENARVAGATADYLRRQLTDFRSGARKYSDSMIAIAKGLSENDIRTAAEYFASLQVGQWVRVVESDIVPRSFVGRGNARLPHPDGSTEALGNRIIELPEDVERSILLDPHSGFVAYVPPGSLAKGEALVAGGGGKTIACVICHGSTLSGIGDVPGIAARSPVYIARQLYNIQDGSRGGSSAALMKAVVDKLNDGEIIAISAYVASLKP